MKLLIKGFKLFGSKKEKYLTKHDYQKNIHDLVYNRNFQGMTGKYKIFDMWQHIIEVENKGNHLIFYQNNVEKIKIWKDNKFENKTEWVNFLTYDL